jgi:hypothetical protein
MIGKVLVVLGMSATLASAQPTLSQQEIAKIKKEVTDVIHHYYQLFTERNMKALPQEIFELPFVLLGPEGVKVELTAEDMTERNEANLKKLLESGWDRSEFPNPSVCVLNPGAAIASGKFYRYKKDGSVLSENAVTYILGKTDKGWRIVSFGGHALDRIVPCQD